MVTMHMKRCSTSLFIKEKHFKTTEISSYSYQNDYYQKDHK